MIGSSRNRLRKLARVQGGKSHVMKLVHWGNRCHWGDSNSRVLQCQCFSWKLDFYHFYLFLNLFSMLLSSLASNTESWTDADRFLCLGVLEDLLLKLSCLKTMKLSFFSQESGRPVAWYHLKIHFVFNFGLLVTHECPKYRDIEMTIVCMSLNDIYIIVGLIIGIINIKKICKFCKAICCRMYNRNDTFLVLFLMDE